LQAPRIYTTQIRSFHDFQDPGSYNHTSVVVLFPERFNEQQTGTYVCQEIENAKQNNVEFHIYFPGRPQKILKYDFFTHLYVMKHGVR